MRSMARQFVRRVPEMLITLGVIVLLAIVSAFIYGFSGLAQRQETRVEVRRGGEAAEVYRLGGETGGWIPKWRKRDFRPVAGSGQILARVAPVSKVLRVNGGF